MMSHTDSKARAAIDLANYVPAMLAMQKELLHTVEGMNRDWLARAQSEGRLVSDFVGKLTTARSIPDATSACQECAARRFEMYAEDSRRLLTNSQKLIETGMRFFTAPTASS
jgi:hypothetical protein